MRLILTSILFNLICQFAFSQELVTINGYVRDSLSGESVIGASIMINGQSKGVTSNQYGFYSITLEPGVYQLNISHVSFLPKMVPVDITSDLHLNIEIMSRSSAIAEVVIIASRRRDAYVKNAEMGKIDLSVNRIKDVPSLLGEVDILRTLQLLPGIRNAGEGNAGFYVRGGGPDQNLIMLDDAVVYNTGHLFGFFSIFNSDAIKNTTLIKGDMPAQYGGRISSVLDVAMKDGNMNRFQADGGIGVISSRLSLQGPLKKDQASFIVSARRTYIDILVKPFISKSSDFHGTGYYFYDLNAKLNYRFTDKDRLYLSGYFGQDVFDYRNGKRSFRSKIPWGNATATMRWNHVFNKKLFANATLVYNNYKFRLEAAQNNFELGLSSGIRDINLKVDFDYYPLPQHKLKFGGLLTRHKFIPNIVSGKQDSVVFTPNNEPEKYAIESAVYIQDDWELNPRLKINYGIRFSRFTQTGPYKKFTRDNDGNKLDSTVYRSLETVRTYTGLEPRFTMRYSLNEEMSIKAGLTHSYQYIHLVTSAASTLPTDLWVPSTYIVKPQISWQYSAGLYRNFEQNMFETSIEVYYKNMKNQVEYKEGYTPSLTDPEHEFVFGRGWSYGTELFINKTRGRFTGWLGYTLSWTWRKFPDLNGGLRYPSRYDRRHDMSIVLSYETSPKWRFGTVFVYGTGSATTLPERFYFLEGVLTQEYSSLNQYRLPAYHRLDFSATYTPIPRKKRKIKNNWVFSIYNVYSRLNPYFIFFDQNGNPVNGTLQVEAVKVSLFPIIPAVTWNFRF